MNIQSIISLKQICQYFQIEVDVVQDFAEFGLYPTVLFNNEIGVETHYLGRLKKVISLYKALGINKEGIEVILELREKNSSLQKEVERLKCEIENFKCYWGTEESEMLQQHNLLIEISDYEQS